MTNSNSQPLEHNRFDRLVVDVPDIYRRFPIIPGGESILSNSNSNLVSLYQLRVLPLDFRTNLSLLLKRLHIDINWFYEFRSYWTSVLGGFKLTSFYDVFYLKNVYTAHVQAAQVSKTVRLQSL